METSETYKGTEGDFDELVHCLTGLGIGPQIMRKLPLTELPNDTRCIEIYEVGSVKMTTRIIARSPTAYSSEEPDNVEVTLAGTGESFKKLEEIVQYHLSVH
jgi:hypothetical protein